MRLEARLFYAIPTGPAMGSSPFHDECLMSGVRYEYVIDGDDVIREVNDAWKTFAQENHAEGLGDEVLGNWLWQYLSGMEVKHLFRVLLDRVRESQEVGRVPFRCDAPGLRRHMTLEMTPLPDSASAFPPGSWKRKTGPRSGSWIRPGSWMRTA